MTQSPNADAVARLKAFAVGGPFTWRDGLNTDFNAMRADLRAAIEAMRINAEAVTDAMIAAGCEAAKGHGDDWAAGVRAIYLAMTAIAMARDSAETACPAPVPQDCQARAESIAQKEGR